MSLSVLFHILIVFFNVNVFRIIILSGTFSLAFAFAGNDLVNFVGVPLAALSSVQDFMAHGTDGAPYMMSSLLENDPAPTIFLLLSGLVMVATLWFSKKARAVVQTSINLSSSQSGEHEQFGSSVPGRMIVRSSMALGRIVRQILPMQLQVGLRSRFKPRKLERDETPLPFDYVRASINLVLSSILIASATSLQLPLSTTYVCFMVAMGSSLADKAWGRESAVYRISGVMTVVAGWFITAVGGFLIALAMGLILIYGGIAAFVVTTLLCGYMLVKSNFFKKNKAAETAAVKAAETGSDIIYNITQEVCATMERTTRIYDRTLIAVFKENRKVLREMVRESNELFYQSRERKYSLLPTLRKLQKGDIDTAHYYVQVVDYLNEMTKALAHITRPAFEHIDNNHEGLSKEQTEDLMHINDDVEPIFRHFYYMLRTGDFSDLDMVLEMRDRLFEAIADAIKSEVTRINENRSNTKASILYLTILNETKSMVLQSRNLLKSQRYFLEHKDGPLQWLNKIK